jgi:hypothetical protein
MNTISFMIREVWFFLRDYREFVFLITAASWIGFLLGLSWINFDPEVITKS